ncbi:hypothetical protein EIL50_04820 [bacterium NHP-B]|nr:hypothetical protein EIL50_04820 [bacterium NHP-B]
MNKKYALSYVICLTLLSAFCAPLVAREAAKQWHEIKIKKTKRFALTAKQKQKKQTKKDLERKYQQKWNEGEEAYLRFWNSLSLEERERVKKYIKKQHGKEQIARYTAPLALEGTVPLPIKHEKHAGAQARSAPPKKEPSSHASAGAAAGGAAGAASSAAGTHARPEPPKEKPDVRREDPLCIEWRDAGDKKELAKKYMKDKTPYKESLTKFQYIKQKCN